MAGVSICDFEIWPTPPQGIEEVCELLAISLDPARRAELGAMPPEQLEALLARLKRERRWE